MNLIIPESTFLCLSVWICSYTKSCCFTLVQSSLVLELSSIDLDSNLTNFEKRRNGFVPLVEDLDVGWPVLESVGRAVRWIETEWRLANLLLLWCRDLGIKLIAITFPVSFESSEWSASFGEKGLRTWDFFGTFLFVVLEDGIINIAVCFISSRLTFLNWCFVLSNFYIIFGSLYHNEAMNLIIPESTFLCLSVWICSYTKSCCFTLVQSSLVLELSSIDLDSNLTNFEKRRNGFVPLVEDLDVGWPVLESAGRTVRWFELVNAFITHIILTFLTAMESVKRREWNAAHTYIALSVYFCIIWVFRSPNAHYERMS